MNKTALMNYALSARKELESQIALSLNKLGIYEDSIKRADIVGDYTIIEGTEETFPKRVYELRNTIISDHIQPDGFKNVVEEFAYTWFNRIIALRFMEVHDYFDHGFRVLTSRDGSYEPEILKNVMYVIDDLKLNKAVVESLSTQGKTEELYRYILFNQCNKLSGVLPMLFSTQEAYMELLLPNNLLSAESVIRKIQEIPEEDFKNDVEVIGWLYQFYNSVKKDEVFASKETITKDTLPAVTQLFTPDWIVRYMAQNSVGRIWLESHPDSPLKEKMKYYVDDAEQTPEVQAKLDVIKYKNVNLETLKIIEPCCGSGHILVYVFDLLLEMYKENGYAVKDIPATILKNNLYGLDVDKRAAQLSQFALMMKARSIDNHFFSETRIVIPHVYEIQDSKLLISLNYQEMIKEFGFTSSACSTIQYLVDTFRDGKVIGSLLKVEKKDYQEVANEIATIRSEYTPNLFQNKFFYTGLNRIIELCVLATVLSNKYDVMVTNPPYCSTGNVDSNAKEYFVKHYPNSKADMFAMFMEAPLVKNNAFLAMVNMQSWMFLKSFEDLRTVISNEFLIESLVHLGAHAFSEIGGEVMQPVSFVLRKTDLLQFLGKFFKETEAAGQDEKEESFLNDLRENRFFCRCFNDFSKVPGMPICFWASKKIISLFSNKSIQDVCVPKCGLKTGITEKYVLLWTEVAFEEIGFGMPDRISAKQSKKKWFPVSDGQEYRKWYGNNYDVVFWENDGYEIRHLFMPNGKLKSRPQNMDFYFKEGITWSALTSKDLSLRLNPVGNIISGAGYGCFCDDLDFRPIMALLNSKISSEISRYLSGTLNYEVGVLARIPVSSAIFTKEISKLVQENIDISKRDWDSFELSWGFSHHSLVGNFDSIETAFNEWSDSCNSRFLKVKTNEEKLNSLLLSIYGLSDSIEPNVSDDSVSIRKANMSRDIKSLVSYFVGLLMGRYSLKKDGLVYAGGVFNSADFGDCVDQYGVLPIFQFVGIESSLTSSICSLIKRIYGTNKYQENLDYLASGLGKISNESSIETINRYLNDSFYQDHLKTYQKRPIYWMFSSGKEGAFKCLFYLHRYNPNTLALINSRYFLPRTALYKSERERLEGQIKTGNLDAKNRKIVEQEIEQTKRCQQELFEYGQILDHMANRFIELNLNDGVKANYEKFQNVTVEMNGQTIKKDLLVPIK